MGKKCKKWDITLGLFFIFLGIFLFLSKSFYYNYLDRETTKKIDNYFENNDSEVINNDTYSKEIKIKENDYIAVLEIPVIALRKGLVAKNSKDNIVSKNIQILDDSDMPDVLKGTMYLAAHSGSSYISFFNNLNKVKNEDLIYIYYNHIKYIYKVVDIYEEIKTGTINFFKDESKTNLVLTTCSPGHKGYQLIVVCELFDKNVY